MSIGIKTMNVLSGIIALLILIGITILISKHYASGIDPNSTQESDSDSTQESDSGSTQRNDLQKEDAAITPNLETLDDAKTFILQAFNNTYRIQSNKATIKTSLRISSGKFHYSNTSSLRSMTVSEIQECKIEDLDPNRIEAAGGIVNIWTINEARKVYCSALPKEQWYISFAFDKNKYRPKDIAYALKILITQE